jgi:predicted MFS family arabinose efflux permease
MALYSTVTYLAAALAVVALGPVYEASGMTGVAAGAAGALLLAVAPAAAQRRAHRPG